MSENRPRCRAEFIREAPMFWFVYIYAVCFFGGSATINLLPGFPGQDVSLGWRYLFPIGMALPFWCGLRSWARHVLSNWKKGT